MTRRWPVFVGGSLLALAVIGIGVASIAVNTGPEAKKVRVATVVRTDVKSRVLAQGRVRARRQVEVGSEITGRVTHVLVELGDRVTVGDPLFSLDAEQLKNSTSQLRVALRATDSMVARAQLMVTEAARGAERDARLKDKGVLAGDAAKASQARVDLANADLQQALAQSERARLDLLRAQDTLKKAAVLAPIDGTVVAVNLEVGQIAAPVSGMSGSSVGGMFGLGGGGDPSATIVIADLSELITKLEVDELDISQLKVGQPVQVMAQGRESQLYQARVTRVGLMGRDLGGSVQFQVEAQLTESGARTAAGEDAGPSEVPNSDAGPELVPLRPGMSVGAEIEVQRLTEALAIPVAAVLEGDDKGKKDRVLVVDEGITGTTVVETPIELGPTDDDIVAVLSGLTADQKIVEGPFRALRALEDGEAIVIDEEVKTLSEKRTRELESARAQRGDEAGE